MTGRESNPASLFQLYVNYGRYAEATYLLLEYIESFASMVNYFYYHGFDLFMLSSELDRIICTACIMFTFNQFYR